MFLIVTATGTAYTGSRRQNVNHPRVTVEDFMPMPRWFPSPPSLAFHRHEGAWLDAVSQLNASGIADTERMWRTEERCRLLVLRSCPEVEQPRVFPLLQELYRKPVLPAGLLLPEDGLRESDGDHGDGAGLAVARPDALRWHDEQPPPQMIWCPMAYVPTLIDGPEIMWAPQQGASRFTRTLNVTARSTILLTDCALKSQQIR